MGCFFLSPAVLIVTLTGLEQAQNPAGKDFRHPIQIRFRNAEFAEISAARQENSAHEILGNNRRQSQETRLEFGLVSAVDCEGANNLDC